MRTDSTALFYEDMKCFRVYCRRLKDLAMRDLANQEQHRMSKKVGGWKSYKQQLIK